MTDPTVTAYVPKQLIAEDEESGVLLATLRVWVHRGHISAPVDGCYDLTEVVAWYARRSERHVTRGPRDTPLVATGLGDV